MKTDRIGRWRLLRPLGRRRDGRLFIAQDPDRGETVVIELMPLSQTGDATARAARRASFLAEAEALARLSHAGIARLRDFGESGDVLWWATESIEGTPLKAGSPGGGLLPPEVAIELVACAADALAAAHEAGVPHRALRPSRLLRVGERGIKIIGFRPGGGSDPWTASGVGYLAPEQVHGQPADSRSDFFSLGAVLYTLATGEPPFPGESDSSTLYRIVHEAPRDPARDGAVGVELAGFLARTLAKDPGGRPRSATSFAEELRRTAVALRVDAALGQPAAARRRPIPSAPPPKARSALAPLVITALAVSGIVGAGLWWARDRLLPARPPAPVWLESQVRTQPTGLTVLLDGGPLAEPGRVRFPSGGPFPLLSAQHACRVVEHRLDPADAGQTIVLVADPTELEWTLDPGLASASVLLNGAPVGATPAQLRLDLCRANRLELAAAGHRTATIDVAAGATPLEARKLLYDITLEEIPQGRLVLPDSEVRLIFHVDGVRVAEGERELLLAEGEHELRYQNDYHWIDRRAGFTVRGGERVTTPWEGVALTSLVVQAFPANCKVYLRQEDGPWRYLDETPASRKVSPGRYEVKVVLNPTGESQLREVKLVSGENPPLRVAFGGRG